MPYGPVVPGMAEPERLPGTGLDDVAAMQGVRAFCWTVTPAIAEFDLAMGILTMNRSCMLLIAVLAIVAARCDYGRPPVHSDEDQSSPASPVADGTVRLSEAASEFAEIEVQEVKLKESKSVLRAMGKLLAPLSRTAIVSHAFTGQVSEIKVGIGDWVKKGQPLVTLESHEVGEAASDFYKAMADLELARLNLERERRLVEQGIGVKKNEVAAEAAYKIAQSSAEAAEKTLHVLGFNEEQVDQIAKTHRISPAITLFAPVDGKVVAVGATLGALVDPSTEILTIIDPTVLWADAEVYEKDIAKVKVGQKVEVMVPAYPGEVFGGKVSYIGDVVDYETRAIVVRAEVDNADFRLKSGMFADVEILLNGNQQMLIIPTGAILEDGDAEIVFVQEGDQFVRRQIETGAIDGDDQQVLSGLEAGEKVVVQGNYQLRSELLGDRLDAADVH